MGGASKLWDRLSGIPLQQRSRRSGFSRDPHKRRLPVGGASAATALRPTAIPANQSRINPLLQSVARMQSGKTSHPVKCRYTQPVGAAPRREPDWRNLAKLRPEAGRLRKAALLALPDSQISSPTTTLIVATTGAIAHRHASITPFNHPGSHHAPAPATAHAIHLGIAARARPSALQA